ncbi:hypothetical protein SAMN02745132_01831 [Enterovibrio nigricans DSM 22720]|uniref:Uncharacterized protein n=2 Tax=Enterovibrio nigricans TaxID=504469 RepID=A0A1T4UIS9_9GAMM|nr:hypothetical protein SAMN02745132_01831 [Enterovibrio nigricans DSM 22720]
MMLKKIFLFSVMIGALSGTTYAGDVNNLQTCEKHGKKSKTMSKDEAMLVKNFINDFEDKVDENGYYNFDYSNNHFQKVCEGAPGFEMFGSCVKQQKEKPNKKVLFIYKKKPDLYVAIHIPYSYKQLRSEGIVGNKAVCREPEKRRLDFVKCVQTFIKENPAMITYKKRKIERAEYPYAQ